MASVVFRKPSFSYPLGEPSFAPRSVGRSCLLAARPSAASRRCIMTMKSWCSVGGLRLRTSAMYASVGHPRIPSHIAGVCFLAERVGRASSTGGPVGDEDDAATLRREW